MPGIINNQFQARPGVLRDVGQFDPANKLHWEEQVGDRGDRQDTVAHGESSCVIRGYVFSSDMILAAMRYWLGWSYVDYSGPFPVLVRSLPVPHPEINSLFARKVNVTGWRYKQKKQDIPVVQGVKVPYAIYHRYLMEVEFQSIPFSVKSTNSIENEWDRFVSTVTTDATEIASIEGGQYIYRATGFSWNSQPATISGQLFRKTIERVGLKITVWNLPADLIANKYGIASKLMKAKGKVNRTLFCGMNPQTFLFDRYEIDKYCQPLASENWEGTHFGCNLHIYGTYQEPKKAIATESFAGWNLVPGLDGRADGAGWFGVQDQQTGAPIYSAMEMNNLITHWTIDDLNIGNP